MCPECDSDRGIPRLESFSVSYGFVILYMLSTDAFLFCYSWCLSIVRLHLHSERSGGGLSLAELSLLRSWSSGLAM